MIDNELVTVIVPVYNDEKYVAQTLDSIINQTYRNLEILVVVDGSKDNSPAICDRYAAMDERVNVFHRENAGVAASRQFGVDNCHGLYFVTVDADDYVAADFVEKLYETIKRNDADVSACGVSCVSEGTGEVTYCTFPDCAQEKQILTKDLLSADFWKITDDLILTDSWNKMHRTQFVRDSGVRYSLSKKYCGSELDFEHKLAFHCPAYCVVKKPLLFHRMRTGSQMQRKDKPFQEGFEIITESLIKECKLVGYPVRECLSSVYYGLIGMVVMDIFFYGGGIRETHTRVQKLVVRNRLFLSRHTDHLERYKGFKTFKVSKYPLPSFILEGALWMDAVITLLRMLYKIKK